MKSNEVDLDAKTIADVYKTEGKEAATKLLNKIAATKKLVLWEVTILCEKVFKLCHPNK